MLNATSVFLPIALQHVSFLPAAQVTIEEELAANPEIAAEIEAEIKDNKW